MALPYPTDLTGAGMGTIPGVSEMELTAVLGREYAREIDPNIAGGLHPIAARWNQNQNYNRHASADDPFGRDLTFQENYMRQFPDNAQRTRTTVKDALTNRARQEERMQAMENANMADAFRNPGMQQPRDPLQQQLMQRMLDQITAGPQTIADGAIDPLTYNDMVNVHQAMQAQQSPSQSNDWVKTESYATFQDHLIDWLSERPDLTAWLDSLGSSLELDTEDTFEVALRMAMEVAYKENEAQMAGLNKKLQEMEEGR